MVDIQCAMAEIRRGKKKEEEEERRRNNRAKIYCPHLLRRAAIISAVYRMQCRRDAYRHIRAWPWCKPLRCMSRRYCCRRTGHCKPLLILRCIWNTSVCRHPRHHRNSRSCTW